MEPEKIERSAIERPDGCNQAEAAHIAKEAHIPNVPAPADLNITWSSTDPCLTTCRTNASLHRSHVRARLENGVFSK